MGWVSGRRQPPSVCYNFDTRELRYAFIYFLAEMLRISKQPRRFTVPLQITCATALPGKMGKRKNRISFTQMLCQCIARIQLVPP